MDHRDKVALAIFLIGMVIIIISTLAGYLAWLIDNDAR